MTDNTKLHVVIVRELLEELASLDEIAGELDAESNSRTDQRRKEIVQTLRDMGENV